MKLTATVPLPLASYLPRPLPAEVVGGARATIATWPIAYVFVEADRRRFFEPVPQDAEDRWEAMRLELAARIGISPSDTIPKIGVVGAGDDGPLFRTRMGRTIGWHDGAPGGGLLAFAATALREGTVPNLANDDPDATAWRIRTPAGIRVVTYRLTPDLAPGLALSITTTDPEEIR